MDFSMTKIISIFYSSMQPKDLFSLNSKEGVDFNKQKYNQLQKGYVMACVLFIGWGLSIET